MTREEMIQAVAQAISNAWDREQRIFEAADAAIAIIRAETLEEAARCAEMLSGTVKRGNISDALYVPPTAKIAAAAIRALKDKP